MLMRAAGTSSRSPATACALVALVLAAGCQPVDSGVLPGGEPRPGQTAGAEADADEPAALAPDLQALVADLEAAAVEWQAAPVLAEVYVDLDGEAWREATATFLAPDADRMLLLQVDADGQRQQRPTLETLDLVPVAAAGLAEVPPLPDGTLGPDELVAAGQATDCALGDIGSVLYSTGAPAAWDGTAWTEPPAWTATLGGDEASLLLDPVTGEALPDGCLPAAG